MGILGDVRWGTFLTGHFLVVILYFFLETLFAVF